MTAVWALLLGLSVCDAFWFYGYDQVYRDPYSETSNNEIVKTSVITYLASQKNVEIAGLAPPYNYKLMMFESVVQYETETPENEWNLGVWDSFIYCNEYEDSLCLLFSDGMYCDNGFFRETAIELTCQPPEHERGTKVTEPTLFDINEPVECIYTGKLYFPELCADKGKKTAFLRTTHEIEKVVAHSYISTKGNLINTIPYTPISNHHKMGISMTISEVEDLIRLTLYGPMDKYFAVGFGSNSMANTYAIVVAGKHSDGSPNFFEQMLDSHGAGYSLQPSWVVQEYRRHKSDRVAQLTLSRRLSTALEMDEYWLFSCVEEKLPFIWSTGKSTKFERHIAFGEDELAYEQHEVKSYDKNTVTMAKNDFKLRINWTGIFVALCVAAAAFFVGRKYKEEILELVRSVQERLGMGGGGGGSGGAQSEDKLLESRNQYGSATQDTEPLMDDSGL